MNSSVLAAIDSLATGVAVVNDDALKICYCNSKFAQWLSCGEGERLEPVLKKFSAEHFQRAMLRKRVYRIREQVIDNGRPVAIEVSFRTVPDTSPNPTYLVEGRVEESEREAEALHQHYEELMEQYRNLLVVERDTARSASEAKSQFLSSMSHELRTPLNAILGLTQLLKLESASLKPIQNDWIQLIHDNGTQLFSQIDRMLDFSQLDRGEFELASTNIPFDVLLKQIIGEKQELATRRSVSIYFKRPEKSLFVLADQGRLKQVVENLLDNAIRYNHDYGAVSVDLGIQGDRVRATFKDTGQGIPAGSDAAVFEPFNRIGHETGTIAGVGIGLPLSKMLIESMGGVIGYQSQPGEGSSFWIDVPRANSCLHAS